MSVAYPASSMVFFDTSAFFALAVPRDSNSTPAIEIYSQLEREHRYFISSNFVIAELHALIGRRVDARTALRVVQEIVLQGPTIVVRISEEDEERALDILTRYTDKDFSYTDATSFAVMERLGIESVFTFDHHFGQYGFQALTADPS